MNERLEARVSGRVQMVMYRDFTQRKARGLKLRGEVSNRKDGTVFVIAEGPRPQLEKLLEKLHRGPLLARVDTVQASWLLPTGEFKKFNISYE